MPSSRTLLILAAMATFLGLIGMTVGGLVTGDVTAPFMWVWSWIANPYGLGVILIIAVFVAIFSGFADWVYDLVVEYWKWLIGALCIAGFFGTVYFLKVLAFDTPGGVFYDATATTSAPPPAADTKTVLRYMTGVDSLMTEEMYEFSGVVDFNADPRNLGYVYEVGHSGEDYLTLTRCLPQVGISTAWVKLEPVDGVSCGSNVMARCITRGSNEYCQPANP